eukprot:7125756-Pyramimonas_sp.AAC.1
MTRTRVGRARENSVVSEGGHDARLLVITQPMFMDTATFHLRVVVEGKGREEDKERVRQR